VHLAIPADDLAVRADQDGSVVIEPRGPLLEERRDNDRAGLAGDFA
jgi:hypothetical protein